MPAPIPSIEQVAVIGKVVVQQVNQRILPVSADPYRGQQEWPDWFAKIGGVSDSVRKD